MQVVVLLHEEEVGDAEDEEDGEEVDPVGRRILGTKIDEA